MFNRLLTLCLIFLIALPAQARFLTQDQWEGDVNNPPSLHKYVYTYQNPTKYTDPSGNIPLLLGLALVGAEIGFFTDFLAQEYETGATSVTDFVKNDYDVKRGAVNTTIGAASGLAGGGLTSAGLSTARAATASVIIDSTLDEAGKTVLTGNAPTAKGFATSAALNTVFLGSGQLGGKVLDASKPYLNKAKDYLPSFPTSRNSSTTVNVEGSSGPNNQSVAMITTENGSVPLNSYNQKGKYSKRDHITYRSADEVNSTFPSNWNPPYRPGTRVTEYNSVAADQFVRVHGEDNAARSWMMRQEAVHGLSPEEIARKYSLPEVPTKISDVNVPEGARMRQGKVAENYEGNEGATQYQWLDRVPESAISNTRDLDVK